MKKETIRISKILSHAGICSRREAESLIKNGHIKIDGKVYKEFLINRKKITSITVFEKEIQKQRTRIWCFYKPVGYVSSNKEQGNQKSLFKLLSKKMPRVVSVGRLDINSEGLMILTNNPSLSYFFEKPQNKIVRIYHVNVIGKISQNLNSNLKKKFNLKLNNVFYRDIFLNIIKTCKENHLFEIKLTEGKNREIRNIMKFYKLKITKLKRIKYGPFELGKLQQGRVAEVQPQNFNFFLKKMNFSYENNFW